MSISAMEPPTWAEIDPYDAVAIWLFMANKDPETFLKLFEGVVPKVRGMEWSPNTGWGYVPCGWPTNMAWNGRGTKL